LRTGVPRRSYSPSGGVESVSRRADGVGRRGELRPQLSRSRKSSLPEGGGATLHQNMPSGEGVESLVVIDAGRRGGRLRPAFAYWAAQPAYGIITSSSAAGRVGLEAGGAEVGIVGDISSPSRPCRSQFSLSFFGGGVPEGRLVEVPRPAFSKGAPKICRSTVVAGAEKGSRWWAEEVKD